jgi:hypothetical protein
MRIMSTIHPDRLFPHRAWFYERLKIYFWAALGSAWLFLLVAAWMADPTQDRSIPKNVMSVVTALLAAAIASLSYRHIKGVDGERHHRRHEL